MKELKYLSLFLFAVVLSLGFVSCGDDDDDVSKSELVGKWECIKNVGYERYESHPDWNDEWDNNGEGVTIKLNEDGTYSFMGESGTWKLDGKKLMLTTEGETQTATILEMSSSKIVLEASESGTDEDGKYEFYSKMTFKKIS